MKKLFFALIAGTFFLQACEGPAGPPGPAGTDGLRGEVHDVQATFNAANKYGADFDFKGKPLGQGDKVVGFILEGKDNQGNENWEPLPQTFFDKGNTFVYTFNFSITGFTIFLDGNADPGTLASDKRTNRIFRMMIVPGKLVNKVNLKDMKDIMAKIGVQESDINVIF